MAYGIGIDTGGTYTDAVVYDFENKCVTAKGKSPTTRQNLSEGIGKALDMLPRKYLEEAQMVSLSTTLATNACVENKGCRAKLILMGTDMETLKWVKADRRYGLKYENVLCIPVHTSSDGTVAEDPDWEKITEENSEFLSQAQALSLAELNAVRNGAVLEKRAKKILEEKYQVPVIPASELVSGLNIMERGATALLNARLLPVVKEFMKAVTKAMADRGLSAPKMVVRSDGSLMGEELAFTRPVETILSGPAASVMGCRALSGCGDSLIVDMGGTTTDISVLHMNNPQMTGGIRIGSWRTQIQGVFIDTFALGGDTRVIAKEGKMCLDHRRVEPICAAAVKWPKIKDDLQKLIAKARPHSCPMHEFLYLMQEPKNMEHYSDDEKKIIGELKAGPVMVGSGVFDMYSLKTDRLENEGVVMRAGLTPTDIMHVRGDYAAFDAQASRLVCEYFLKVLPDTQENEEGLLGFCENIYDLVKERLFVNLCRVFLENTYPDVYEKGMQEQMKKQLESIWQNKNTEQFMNVRFFSPASVVGMGAPISLFLPDVAKMLGAKCVIPEHSEVANAVGTVVADIQASRTVEIRVDTDADGAEIYSIHAPDQMGRFKNYEEAIAAAKEAAVRLAKEEARLHGAMGEMTVEVWEDEKSAASREGAVINLGTSVTARVSDRVQL